jgi:hypothetical protein
MAKPKMILKPKKAEIAISGGILPKVKMTREEFWRSINELLGHCLDGCGIQADIIVGEDRDSYFVQGRLKNHRGPAGRAEGNP